MTSLLPFTNALADASRLRLLHLALNHKVAVSELRPILGLDDGVLAANLKLLVEVGLVKNGGHGAHLKVKHKHAAILRKLFSHFKVGSKKDEQTRSDEKKLRQLRHAKPASKTVRSTRKKVVQKKR
jgi:predicted transcriptional regulator